MSNQASTSTTTSANDIQARLAQINAAVAARTGGQAGGPNPAANAPEQSGKPNFVCPIDPAERAACDACQ